MWWYDQDATEVGEKLRDEFGITTFIESGTYRGVNLRFWSYRFNFVFGVEVDSQNYWQSSQKLDGRPNVELICQDSSRFLSEFVANYYQDRRTDIVLIYLDAHFYSGKKTKEGRWVVLRELKALNGFKNCVLVIHDFNCQDLYGLVYDGEPLNFALVKDELAKINPDFSYYNNIREYCNPHTKESIIGVEGIDPDAVTLETISYHRTARLKYRGILYCTPSALDLRDFTLKEIDPNQQ